MDKLYCIVLFIVMFKTDVDREQNYTYQGVKGMEGQIGKLELTNTHYYI